MVARGLRRDLEQEGALADAGLAGQQDRGTRAPSPPPSTRSSSGTPLVRNAEASTDTWAIGSAALVTGPASARIARGAAASATDPQAWHSPHRPTHFADVHPHSEHW